MLIDRFARKKTTYDRTVHTRRDRIPLFVLLFGVLITFLSAYYVNTTAIHEDQLRFDNAVRRTQNSIQNRLDTYIFLLRAGTGFIAGSEYVTGEEFTAFYERLQLKRPYSGIQGIGYIVRVPAQEKEAFIERMQQEGKSDFSIRPDDPSRLEYYPITYLEPGNSRNNFAIGFDMYSEKVRQRAMETARDTGEPATSGKVTLIQEVEGGGQTGFLIFTPVYTGGTTPKDISERKEKLSGFVYSPFRLNDLMRGIFGNEPPLEVAFTIFEKTNGEEMELFDSSTMQKPTEKKPSSRFQTRTAISIAGTPWFIDFKSRPEIDDSSETQFIPYIIVAGVLASLMLFFITELQLRARAKAEKAAIELRKSRNKLQQSEQLYRRVVEYSTDLISVTDTKGLYQYVSPSFQHLLGYERKELVGKDRFKFIHPDDAGVVREGYTKHSKEGRNVVYRYKHKSGHYLTLEGAGSYVFDSEGKPQIMLITSHDITQRAALEKKREEFISMTSHELKTPVTSLKAFAQVLERRFTKSGDAESAGLLSKMDSQLDKLSNLISDLLDVTRIEGGRLKFHEEEFKMDELIAEIVEELQRTTDTHKIVREGRVKRKIYGDRERIGQVLTNLLSNAIKYSPNAGKIIVKETFSKNTITVCVKDFGLGISKEGQKHIFERFFRGDEPKKVTYPGLGLGLYISSEIVKRQRGRIWVKSDEGQGSTFCFSLPIRVRKNIK